MPTITTTWHCGRPCLCHPQLVRFSDYFEDLIAAMQVFQKFGFTGFFGYIIGYTFDYTWIRFWLSCTFDYIIGYTFGYSFGCAFGYIIGYTFGYILGYAYYEYARWYAQPQNAH